MEVENRGSLRLPQIRSADPRIAIPNFVLIVFLLWSAILGGCAKKQDSAQLQIAIPRATQFGKSSDGPGALATIPVITRVMINITGPGMAVPVVKIWDLEGQLQNGLTSGSIPTPPDLISLDVTKGTGRLIQVLVVRQSIDTSGTSSNSTMDFYYGDALKDVAQSSQDVDVTLTAQGSSSGGEGSISGRYLNADGSGLTGKVNMYFTPSGKPPMIVDSTMIFSGYFEFFLLKNFPFSFRTLEGISLFENITVDSLNPSSQAAMKIVVPASYRQYMQNNVTVREARPERTTLLGYFGPGVTAASTRAMCYDSSPATLNELYTTANVNDTTRVTWDPVSALATRARVLSGGYDVFGRSCPVGGGALGLDFWSLNTQVLAYGDSPLGFRGPFAPVANSANGISFVNGTLSGTTLTLSWKYLSGVIGTSVDGVGVFTKLYAAGEKISDRWGDGALCNQLAGLGFSEVTRVAAGTAAAPVETIALSAIDATAYNQGRLQTLLCPYTNSKPGYYDFALSFYNRGGGGPLPATQTSLKILTSTLVTTSAQRQKVASNSCFPLKVSMLNGSMVPSFPSRGATQLTLTTSDGLYTKLFNDSVCSLPAGGAVSLNVSMNSPETIVYFQPSAGASNFDISVADTTSGGGTPLAPFTYYGTSVSPSALSVLMSFTETTTIKAHMCYPVTYARGFMSGADFVADTGGSSDTGTLSSLPSLTFYNDPGCSSPAGLTLPMNNLAAAVVRYFKYAGVNPSIDVAPVSVVSSLPAPSALMTVEQPGVVSRIRLSMQSNFPAESCQSAQLQAVDANGYPSPLTAAISTSWLFNGSAAPPANGGLYSDSLCQTSVSSVSMSAGLTQSNVFYFRWPTPSASIPLSATVSGLTLPFDGFTITTGPATLGYLVARLADVTYSPMSGYLGQGPQKVLSPTSFMNILLEARSPLGNLITTFNDPNFSNTGLNVRNDFGEYPNCSGITAWTGGMATLQNCSFPYNAYAGRMTKFFTGGTGAYPFHSTLEQFFLIGPGDSQAPNVAAFSGKAASGLCQPLLVTRAFSISQGFLAQPVQTASNIPLSTSAGISGFYSSGDCTGPIVNATIPAGDSATVVYMLLNGTTPVSPLAGGASPFDTILATTPTYPISSVTAATTYQFAMSKSLVVGSCNPAMVVRTDSGGAAVPAPSPLTLTLSSSLDLKFYSQADCAPASQVTARTINTGQSTALFYVKAPTTSGGTLIMATDNAGTPLSGNANLQSYP